MNHNALDVEATPAKTQDEQEEETVLWDTVQNRPWSRREWGALFQVGRVVARSADTHWTDGEALTLALRLLRHGKQCTRSMATLRRASEKNLNHLVHIAADVVGTTAEGRTKHEI